MIGGLNYNDIALYCGFDVLPKGLEDIYKNYKESAQKNLIERDFLYDVYE